MKIKCLFLLCCPLILCYSAMAQLEPITITPDSPSDTIRQVYDINEIHLSAEQMPMFNYKGMNEYEFVSKNMIYPKVAKEQGIECKIAAMFVIEKDGSISNIRFITSTKGYGFEEEMERILKLMPKWQPGKENGEVVRVSLTLPIRFKL